MGCLQKRVDHNMHIYKQYVRSVLPAFTWASHDDRNSGWMSAICASWWRCWQ